MRLTINEALRIIHISAVAYQNNLVGKNVLFFSTYKNKTSCFEVAFLARNFLHFTGVATTITSSTLFFRKAVDNELAPKDITIAPDGTSELKLDVLPTLMNLPSIARMLGDYNNSKSLLVTDKLAGTVTAAMGFVNDRGYYIPNTVLKEDLRHLTVKPHQRIIAIFIKNQKDKNYSTLSYIAKGFTIDDDIFNELAQVNVDMNNLKAKFKIPKADKLNDT